MMTAAYVSDGKIVALVDEDGIDEEILTALGIDPSIDRMYLVPSEARVGDDYADWA